MASVVALASLLPVGCAKPRVGSCVGSQAAGVLSIDEPVLVNTDASGLAIEGHDPVAYFTLRKPVRGDAKFRSTSMGATYQFVSAENKRLFDADPQRYAPHFGGYCAYAASINKISPIDPAYWEIVDGRLILQHNQKAWDAWHKDPSSNLVKADANWPGLVKRNGAPPRQLINIDANGLALQGYDPVTYFTLQRPVQGSMEFARSYQGATYYFASKDNKDLFEAEPAKYVPEFGGFCGYAASINKVSPINPQHWQLVEGRLVLQHTSKAFELFNQDVTGNYVKAQRNWPGLMKRRCGT
jgi:YHS domain-containing protein